MERVTVRMPREQVKRLELRVDQGEFPNLSEAVRQAVRDMLDDRSDPAFGHHDHEAIIGGRR